MNEFDSIGPSWALLCAALALAVAAPASRAAVSQTQETTQSAPASSAADAALRGRVIRLLSEDPDTRLLALSVEVREGIAYLRGGAPNLKVRNDALLVAGRVNGLLGLQDEIEIPPFKEGDERLAEALIERVNRALRSVRVSATVENGVGTLVGRVRTPSERARARNAALEMEGLQGLDNQLLALSDADLDDTRMRVRLIELIENRRQYPMEGDILVEVENGVVSLSGQVPRVYDRLIAERVVDIVSGVRGLRNEIEVVPAAGGHVTRTVPVQP
jgi:osmotically-inducible protein OsmY